MSKRTPFDEKALAERLRREDRETQPEFSEELHAKICRSLRAARAPSASVERETLRSRRAIPWAVAAIAATVVLAVGIFQATRWAMEPSPMVEIQVAQEQPQEPSPASPSVDSIDGLSPVVDFASEVPAKLPALVDSTIRLNNQWAYLDHDARLTVELLKNRLPFDLGASFPASKAERSP